MKKYLKLSDVKFFILGIALVIIDLVVSEKITTRLSMPYVGNITIDPYAGKTIEIFFICSLLVALILGFVYAAYTKENLTRADADKIMIPWIFMGLFFASYATWSLSQAGRTTGVLVSTFSILLLLFTGFCIANYLFLLLGSYIYQLIPKKK